MAADFAGLDSDGLDSDERELDGRDSVGPVMLSVGRIGRAHGLRGDVVVHLSSEREERLALGATFETDRGPFIVVSRSRLTSGWKVHFEGVPDRTAAEALRGLELRAEPIEVEGVIWVHDLIGSVVVESDGLRRGEVVAVEENPAHDLLVVADAGRQHLVPMVFVTAIGPKLITIDPPDGLFELV